MKHVMITELKTTLDIDIIKSELQEVMKYDGFRAESFFRGGHHGVS